MPISDDDFIRQGDPDCNFDKWDSGLRTCPECGQPTDEWDEDAEMCKGCAPEEDV